MSPAGPHADLTASIPAGSKGLDYVGANSFVDLLSRVAILVLLFLAGLETSILEIKRGGKTAFYVASIGIVSPMVLGLITAARSA